MDGVRYPVFRQTHSKNFDFHGEMWGYELSWVYLMGFFMAKCWE
jgi:hypothetical protein